MNFVNVERGIEERIVRRRSSGGSTGELSIQAMVLPERPALGYILCEQLFHRALVSAFGGQGERMIRDISLADNEIAVFSNVVVNNSHGDDSVVQKAIEGAATQIAHTGASAVANVVGATGGAVAGAAIGGLIGSSVTILGTIIGAALGALISALFCSIINLISPNCDGAIGAAAQIINRSDLQQKVESRQNYDHKDSNPRIDSRAECGRNSEHYTIWRVKKSAE
ncbi:hypothetical protein K469DRAFT_690857 [Zopfia rhizophila CBS 207.26]|uniref:Glycine zipper domain-containing protein n=1 Tax=Zopfia rhizophila CBS 207.26 TaxID=1314779 RepID=A0A6A6DTK5_9PEZI|nr:hypothetical protein K469DRAFT_690857 [Zopfia rhizophila CBS 207.26]